MELFCLGYEAMWHFFIFLILLFFGVILLISYLLSLGKKRIIPEHQEKNDKSEISESDHEDLERAVDSDADQEVRDEEIGSHENERDIS